MHRTKLHFESTEATYFGVKRSSEINPLLYRLMLNWDKPTGVLPSKRIMINGDVPLDGSRFTTGLTIMGLHF